MSEKKYGPVQGGSMEVYKVTQELKGGQAVLLTIPGLNPFETTIVSSNHGHPQVEVMGNLYYLGDKSNGHKSVGHDWTFRVEQPQPKRLKFATGSVVEHNASKFRYMVDGDGVWHSSAGITFQPGDVSITSTIEHPDTFKGFFTLLAGSYDEAY